MTSFVAMKKNADAASAEGNRMENVMDCDKDTQALIKTIRGSFTFNSISEGSCVDDVCGGGALAAASAVTPSSLSPAASGAATPSSLSPSRSSGAATPMSESMESPVFHSSSMFSPRAPPPTMSPSEATASPLRDPPSPLLFKAPPPGFSPVQATNSATKLIKSPPTAPFKAAPPPPPSSEVEVR
eukprot:TRINITY_DN51462_c0_g1_i1.p1 TRINITY_DN51462_c0_g1~~TRINITY_DN51462_c0_g1_i1.p1  ORF type:complete len:185 (-),score=42.62 TRINITY_DN51462_c0_g1_i1:258-812(-)